MISDEMIRHRIAGKFTVQEIADLHDVPYSTLWNRIKRLGLHPAIARRWTTTKEIATIMTMRESGRSYEDISRVVGRTRNSIAGIVHREKARASQASN